MLKVWLNTNMKKEYCKPATFDDLKKIIRALNENGAEYILIGGYALYSHGYHRATEDIDLLIHADSKKSKPIVKSLMVLSDQQAEKINPEWFNEGENIRLCDEIVVDLLFKTCGETYDTLKPYIEHIDLDGIKVQTLSLEGLLKTKQSSRDKDKLDRVIIERALYELTKIHEKEIPEDYSMNSRIENKSNSLFIQIINKIKDILDIKK